MKKPNYIIAGERRSGTTTIGKWIECHPELYINPNFDKAFFMDDEIRGVTNWTEGFVNPSDWDKHTEKEYLETFKDATDKHIAIGEKSADYLFLENSHQRIANWYPNIKLVLTLRNPSKRAWSHYWNEVGKKRESLSFNEAVEQEQSRISKSDYAKAHLSYTSRGMYINSIKKLFNQFPKENVHIIILEEAIKNPKEELSKLYQFLGVNPKLGLENAGKRFNNNWTTIPKSFWLKNKTLRVFEEKFINRFVKLIVKLLYKDFYTRRFKLVQLQKPFRVAPSELKMDDQQLKMLDQIFYPSIKELEQFLGKDLSIWKNK